MNKGPLVKLEDVSNDKLEDVDILWSTKFACPIYILANGDRYMPLTGEYAGYYGKIGELDF